MLKLDRTDAPAAGEHATVYVVFELSKKRWQLGVLLPGSKKLSRYSIAGGDLTALASRLARCRTQAGHSGASVRILSCYEAGLDGHWLHRWLTDQGVISHEVDPSSIEVSRRARRSAEPWSGRRNTFGRTKKLIRHLPEEFRYACLLTSTAPYKDGWSAAIPITSRHHASLPA
jgi:hypothetical protein